MTLQKISKNALYRNAGWLVALLLLQLSATLPVWAQSAYLCNAPDGVSLLAPPPEPGSDEQAADLATVRAVAGSRTPEQAAHATKSATLSMFLFEPAIGPWFKPGNLPKVEQLFAHVKKEIGHCIEVPKEHWQRARPYTFEPDLLLGKPERSYSYPSGHSTRGTVYALVMAEVFPEKRASILAIGRQIGWDRVVIGKHFPTDVYAGRVLGQAIFRELKASESFQSDLAEAKAEIQKLNASVAPELQRAAQ